MEIFCNRTEIKHDLKTKTFQAPFPEEKKCVCGHRMLPILMIMDEEGTLVHHRPKDLEDGEFWFHDSTAIAVYMCVVPGCGKMVAEWNQA